MLPIGDDNTYRLRTPLVTWLFIAANILAFIFVQGFGTNESVIYSYSMVPQEILSGEDLVAPSGVVEAIPGLGRIPVYLTLLTSLFLHGGIAHIAGNMLFLSIFGDNVEDRLGHLRYFLFYLLSGLAGSIAHIAVSVGIGDGLLVPTLGASGAISGVMGAYLLLFPGNRVRVLLFGIIPTTVNAFLAIGMWFLFQIVNGLGYLGGSRDDGIAYAAHIGGFLFGLFVVKRFLPRRRRVRHHYL